VPEIASIMRRRFERWPWVLYCLWCAAVTLLVYGRALRLPFFFDDLVHIPFVDSNSLVDIWQSAGNLAYYRPLPFTIWKVMYAVLGNHDPLVQHGFNLLLHGLNGILVGWLAWQLSPADVLHKGQGKASWLRPYLSATLFLLFPFSYQAVPWVGSLAHLLVTSLILLSLASYWRYRQSRRPGWAILSLLFTLLAPFAHENGILVSPLLAVILVTRNDGRYSTTQIPRQLWPWALPGLLWLPIWWLAPKAIAGSVSFSNGEAMLQNAAYFLQGAAYPLAGFGEAIRTGLEANDMAVAVTLSFVGLTACALILWRTGASRISWLPWCWIALAALPAVLVLSFDYVINGPRLLMLASVGVAWLWAEVALSALGLLGSEERTLPVRWAIQPLLVMVLVGALLLQNYAFIRDRMSLHQLLGETYRQVITDTEESNGEGKAAVFVNLPTWVAPGTSTFALGHEGVQFLPDYAAPETLVNVNTGVPAELEIARNDAIRPEMPYFYGLGRLTGDWQSMASRGSDIYVADFKPEAIDLRFAGTLATYRDPIEPLSLFEEFDRDTRIALLSGSAALEKEGLVVRLVWAADGAPSEQVTVFVHLIDGQGQLLDQIDGDLLLGSYPLSLMGQGTLVQERRVALMLGEARSVLVGLYNRFSGDRLVAYDRQEQRWSDDAVPLPLN